MLNFSCFNRPISDNIILSFAVNILVKRTKLSLFKEPLLKSDFTNLIAFASPYFLLVIWHNIQSFLPAEAKTSAGRNFDFDKSENGKRISTTEHFEGNPKLPPLPVVPNLLLVLLH